MEYDKVVNYELESLDPSIGKKEVIQYDQSNPFFLDLNGSPLKYTKTNFLADEYTNVYILCLRNDFVLDSDNKNLIKMFYDPNCKPSKLKKCSDLITLIKGPFKLVQIQSIRAGLISIGKEILEIFNNYHLDLNSKELVYLMLEAKETSVQSWLEIYNEQHEVIDEFISHKIFSSYYKLNDEKMDHYLLSLINKSSDSNYWQDKKHCNMSIGNAFSERRFNLSLDNKFFKIDDIDKELEKLLKTFKESKGKLKSEPYPTQITDPKSDDGEKTLKNHFYVDASKTDQRFYYELVNSDNLTTRMDTIEELLVGGSLSEREKFQLICNLLISKNYCHYILTNERILEANQMILRKYKPIFKYLIGYAWMTLYTEESIRRSRTKENDRFVLDINTASKLPVFPFSPEVPHLNPYFCLTVPDSLLNMDHNINGVKQSIDYQDGIVNLDEFRRRLNIFITGYADKNLLEGANWDNMVITGGCMAAILPKLNPLMALFRKNADPKVNITDQELYRFLQEYYGNSDVDVACNHDNMLDFIAHVKHLKTVIQKNLGPEIKESDILIEPMKSLAIYINSKILKNKCDRGEIPFTYEYIINNKHKRLIKYFFNEMYRDQKKIANVNNIKILGDKIDDDEYFEIINCCDLHNTTLIINDHLPENEINNRKPEMNSGIETVYYVFDKNTIPLLDEELSDGETEIDHKSNVFIKFSETLKFKIHSKYLKHAFEMFRITEHEFFSCVGRFHLPCVRSYYNGNNCYLLPSAITAYHTLTNIEFKYFVGSRDPISIIDKYRARGYGTVMNKTEITQYLSYILSSPVHQKAYNVKDKTDIKNILGSIDVNNDYYKPRKIIPEEFKFDPDFKLEYMTPKLNYLCGREDIIKYYKKRYSKYVMDFIDKRSVLPNGNMEPIKCWMIDASYDLLN